MNQSIEQAQVFLIFFLAGSIIGIFFDCFRILRKVVKTSDFLTALEDGIFWILTGIFLIYLIFIFHDGEIRLFLFLGTISGLLFYFATFSKFFVPFSVKVIKTIIRYVFVPIFQLLSFFLKPFQRFFLFLKKKIIICFIKIKEHKKMLKEKTKRNKFTIFSKKATKKEGIL